jgi:hypothetical protein
MITLALALWLVQDLDVALRPGSRPAGSVLDEISDPAERAAFQALLKETDPLRRRSSANAFLQRYPDSWLYAQAHEAAARACFALGDVPTALFHARQSLAVYPENAALLATVAAIEHARGDKTAAAKASRADDLARRFDYPNDVAAAVRATYQRITRLAIDSSPPGQHEREREPASAYAGSAACRGCHTAQFDAWRQTGMANMLAPIATARVIGDFERPHASVKPTRKDGAYFLDLPRDNGQWDRHRIHFTIGSKWQQAYATKAPNGDLHVLPFQYNILEKAWINYWRTIDPAGSARADPAGFHRFGEVTSYQRNCAPCHASVVDEKSFAEPGVNCEACHGPSAAHARGEPQTYTRLTSRQQVEVCAQCHAQSALRTPQAFPPAYQRRPYHEFSRKAFYKDGRFRETTFIVEAFERSACYQVGNATCSHCHDPHPPDAASNSKSLKFGGDSGRMCLQCHAPRYATRTHTRHAATQCVDCHMPKIMNSLKFMARTHQIDDRPNAAMAARFGPRESPNACLTCHAEKNASWLSEQLRSWR